MAVPLSRATIPESLTFELSELLGMFVGDGCLPYRRNGRDNFLSFYSCDTKLIERFSTLVYDCFGIKGKIRTRNREVRRPIHEFGVRDKRLCDYLVSIGFAKGKKANKVSIPSVVMGGDGSVKIGFLRGLIETDAGLSKHKRLMFHCASLQLLVDVRRLIMELFGHWAQIKEYNQRGFWSYQLTYKRSESRDILSSAGVAEWPTFVHNIARIL